jgi:hypothetical protein
LGGNKFDKKEKLSSLLLSAETDELTELSKQKLSF